MATPFGSFATGLVQAQERQRKQQQEEADRAERAEMAKLQRDALMSGMQEKKDAKALQQTRLGQRVSTLRRQPQFADYGDDELAGIASDDAAYQKLLMESLSPKTAARDPVADYLAKRKIDIDNPLPTGPKGPVMGSPEWLAARDAEMTLQDKHRPPRAGGGSGMTNSNMLTLRGQFNGEAGVKTAAEIAAAHRKVTASAQNPSPAGDISLLVAYNKMIDPGAVVREQDFKVAAKAGSFSQQVQAAATQVANGQRLTPEQRADFVARSQDLARAQAEQFRGVYSRYTNDAKAAGLDPARVVYDPFEGVFDAPSTRKANPDDKPGNVTLGGGRGGGGAAASRGTSADPEFDALMAKAKKRKP